MLQNVNKVGIPYDPNHPISALLQPGETLTLYGDITFTNNTDHPVEISLQFNLPKGFLATIDGQDPIAVHMHQNYLVDASKPAIIQQLLDTVNQIDLPL